MEIQPDKQNLDQTFATTVYHIDFYQRDYKWTEEPVRRLLDDVFYQFEEAYARHAALAANKENVNGRYPWYYFNTYVTNHVGGRVFVVDGQQRLTTLTLILIRLHALAGKLNSKTKSWLERKIAGYSGTEHEFWMNHARHPQVLKGLFEGVEPGQIDVSTGITAVNMDRARALFPADVVAWVRTSQPKAWEALVKNHGSRAEEMLLNRLRDQLDQRGTLDVLRHGVELLGLRQPVKLAEFKPALAVNPDLLARYGQNRLRVVRQVRYSLHHEKPQRFRASG